MLRIFLVALSFVIGVFFIKILQGYDIHEKEPFIKMAAATLVGGALSFLISAILYAPVYALGMKNLKSTVGALFIIGPVEEVAMLVAFVVCLAFIKEEMNEPTDGLVYMGCVALGFSVIENYFRVLNSEAPFYTLVTRLIFSTPGHMLFSIIMGLAVYAMVKENFKWPFLAAAYIYASLLHGVYDALLFSGFGSILIIPLLVIAYSWTRNILGYVTAVSPFRVSLKKFVQNYENPPVEKGMECLKCGNQEDKRSYRLGKLQLQECPQCFSFVATKDTIFYIFRHFGSTFRSLTNEYKSADSNHESMNTVYRSNYISESRNLAYFNLQELSEVLEEFNVKAYAGIPWFFRPFFRMAE